MVDGQTGFMLEAGDVGAFVERLDAIVENPERYRDLGERGRQRARALFSADRIVGEYLDYYQEVLDS
jgi:glycosyltransferase involved in cell wall biosynthesis